MSCGQSWSYAVQHGSGENRARRTEDVEEGEVDGGARRALPPPVEDGLRVEGGRPAQEVDPAEEAREEGEEAHCGAPLSLSPCGRGAED